MKSYKKNNFTHSYGVFINQALYLLIGVTIFFSSCNKDSLNEEEVTSIDTQNVITKEIPNKYLRLVEGLSKQGFNQENFEYDRINDEIIYQKDIIFNEKHLRKEKNYYWTNNGIISRENSRNISYYIDIDGTDAFPTNYRTPLRTAFEYWSNSHTNITITETTNETNADIICKHSGTITSVGRAEFPSNNNIGSRLYVNNTYNNSYTENENLTLLLHEIGHALGYTHSDINEGNPLIPDTNNAQWHIDNTCGSIMRSSVFPCNWTLETSDWSANDITSINYIFNDTGDADGDGILTINEDGTDSDPTNDDTDGDGIPDYLDLTIHKQNFKAGFGNYTKHNNSTKKKGVKSFETTGWGVISSKSSNFKNNTIIRNWLISPIIKARAGDKIKIIVASSNTSTNDEFELRLSKYTTPALPTSDNLHGDFTTKLLTGKHGAQNSNGVVSFLNNGNWQTFEAVIPESVGNRRKLLKIALIHLADAGLGDNLEVKSIEIIATRADTDTP